MRLSALQAIVHSGEFFDSFCEYSLILGLLLVHFWDEQCVKHDDSASVKHFVILSSSLLPAQIIFGRLFTLRTNTAKKCLQYKQAINQVFLFCQTLQTN